MGSLTLLLSEGALERIILPLVAFAAGSLIGGAFFHMMPVEVSATGSVLVTSKWIVLGFLVFFALEQFLHHHHCHRASAACRQPLTYLVLMGDGLHNLLGGLAVAGTFPDRLRLGISTWLAAAAHEIPQELGDFGVPVHGGWPKAKALVFNLLVGIDVAAGEPARVHGVAPRRRLVPGALCGRTSSTSERPISLRR